MHICILCIYTYIHSRLETLKSEMEAARVVANEVLGVKGQFSVRRQG